MKLFVLPSAVHAFMCGAVHALVRDFPRSNFKPALWGFLHRPRQPAFEVIRSSAEWWVSGYKPDGENGIENHATERRCRHEWPDGIAPNVVYDIPTGMHQPGDADE